MTGVQTCALPIYPEAPRLCQREARDLLGTGFPLRLTAPFPDWHRTEGPLRGVTFEFTAARGLAFRRELRWTKVIYIYYAGGCTIEADELCTWGP